MTQQPPPSAFQFVGITIDHAEYKTSGTQNLPAMRGDQVSVVVAGSNLMTRTMNGVRSTGMLRPTDVTVVPRGTASVWLPRVEERSQVLHLTLLDEAWADLVDGLVANPERVWFDGCFAEPDPLLMQLLLALFKGQHAQTRPAKMYAESLALSLKLHMLARHAANKDVYHDLTQTKNARFRYTVDYIQSHLAEDLSLEVLASLEGLSVYHFARTFRAEIGASPRQFIINERVNRAKQLLKSSDPISEIAMQVGFANQSHFTRCFKRVTGQTPNQYRNS